MNCLELLRDELLAFFSVDGLVELIQWAQDCVCPASEALDRKTERELLKFVLY